MFRSISRVRALFAISGILCFALSAQAAGRPPVEVVKENRIDARIDNLRLDKVLRLMSEKKLFEIMGSVPSEEEITLYFSGLTLPEAMGKLLRRYNYVLMNRPSKEPLLILMGKIERRTYTEKAAPEEPSMATSQQSGAETDAAPQTQLPRTRRRGGDTAASIAEKAAQMQAQQPETVKRPAEEGQQGAAAPKAQEAPGDGAASIAQKAAQAQAQQPATVKQPAVEGQQGTATPKAQEASEASKEGSPPQQAGQAPTPVATGTNSDTLVWTAEGRF